MNVDISRLTVTYHDDGHALLALDHVDLRLRPGRVTALVGESGSGKTTLAKAVMGLLPDNARINGDILADGRQMAGLGETEMNQWRWRSAAMVFQNGAATLNPLHRVLDQVAEPLIQRDGQSRFTARARARTRLMDIGLHEDHLRRYPHQLSGGQIQRVLMAMAMILDPPVLILDEPTASLDAMTRSFVAGVIDDLRGRGKTILLITHDMDLAGHLADDIAVLYLGQIMETLPAQDLFQNPRHPYTLALVRSYPSMDAARDLGGIRGDAYYRVVHAHACTEDLDHSHVAVPDAEHRVDHAPTQGCLFQPRCTQAIPPCGSGTIPMTPQGSHGVRCLRGGIAQLLAFEGVAKAYGSVRALRPIDLALFCGEVFCLVGETGSGKTTLAMLAAGALRPDSGRIRFDGRDMGSAQQQRIQEIGMIHQNPSEAVSHRFTVFDIVAEPLRIQRNQAGIRNRKPSKEDIRQRVFRALRDVHLSTEPEFLKRYPHELNMGAIQRLCLARALVHHPKLLIADEPTSALDPSVQAKILKMLLALQTEKGLTMLFVTHDIGLARKIGDRIGVMLAGRLVESGPAIEVLNRPAHPYTRMLIRGATSPDAFSLGASTAQIEEKPGDCPFARRCAYADGACRQEQPCVPLKGGRHLVRCCHPSIDHGHQQDFRMETGLGRGKNKSFVQKA